MRRSNKGLLVQFVVVAALAVAAPAFAADAVAAIVPAAAPATMDSAIYQSDAAPGTQADSTAVATHGPARLNILVGNDDAAWASAHSVHVNFSAARAHRPH